MTRLPSPRDRHVIAVRSPAPSLAAHILDTGRQHVTLAAPVGANPAPLTAIGELGR